MEVNTTVFTWLPGCYGEISDPRKPVLPEAHLYYRDVFEGRPNTGASRERQVFKVFITEEITGSWQLV